MSKNMLLLFVLLAPCFMAHAQTTTFNFNGTTGQGQVGVSGTPQTYVVPAGVTSLGVDMYGAAGGWPCCSWTSSSSGGPRANGGRVQCTLNVTPGETLYIYVGGKGGDNYSDGTQIPGGWNGGGIAGAPGSSFSASGGGESDIRTSTSGAYASSVLVVAGGGGGGGDFGPVGGAGGGLTGAAGGGGGACGGGQTGPACATGVGLGTQGQGGSCVCYSAGGGGGGWWGGNGGVVNNGAGGGGSSYSHPTRCSGVTHTQGFSGASANGRVIITELCSTPPAISGSSTVCLGGTSSYSNSTSGGTWSSSNVSVATINSSGVATGVSLGTAAISYVVPGGCFITRNITVSAAPNVSNFTSTTATNYCSGAGSTVTISSMSIGAGTYTVMYNLSGANTSTGNTATLTMGASIGTFTIPVSLLSSNGSTTVTVTGVAFAGCNATPASSNVASFMVGRTPDISNFTSPSATNVCAGVNSTATVNSTTLGAGTYTVTYTLSGASSSSGNTAVLTMGASNGTFTIPGTLLTGGGSTTMTITSIQNVFGCSVSPGASNAATFTVSAASVSFSMTGGGSYCAGGAGMPVGISASTTGNNYQLYNGASTVGSPVAGTGSAISFGTFTATGTYTVLATNTTSSCTRVGTGTAVIGITGTPGVYSISGGGNYCSGDVASAPEIILLVSDPGVVYTVFQSVTPLGTAMGTGGPISLGTYTAAGTYIAIANVGAGAGCQTSMAGSATIGINPLPNVYSVTGGGNYCAGGSGVAVGMSFGQTGVLYNLRTVGGGTLTSAAGTNSAITFGSITTPGTYSVQATTTATGCMNAMTGTVTIGTVNVPVAQTVTGGGVFCSGGSGVNVSLSNSASGVNYQLFNGTSSISTMSGTGSSITFGNQTAAGVYTVLATQTTGSVSCTTPMSGSATVVVNSNPAVYSVTGGGSYCAGGTGLSVGLNGSQAGVNYSLYTGTTLTTTIAGTGSAISFGTFTAAGTYTVRATNATTSCVSDMSGNAVISINSLPLVNSVGGGGSYCAGSTGLAVTLSGSQTGVNYTLSRSGSVVSTLPGTGGSLTYGPFTEAGLYTIVATNTTTGCVVAQSGSATISINPLPTVQTVTGGGNYCSGSTGVVVGLGGGQSGVTYTLYRGTTLVTTVASTSSAPVSFPAQTVAGTYSAYAVITATGCGTNMSGSTTIGINPLPTAYAVTGTGNYCSGGTGVAVGLAGSQGGVTYNLYNGTSIVGSASGTGAAVSFGLYTTASTYTVLATNATTGCTNTMSGGAIVGINPLPTAVTVTSSASSYCAGGTGIDIGLSGSTSGISYQLYMGSTTAGIAVSGTGGPLTIGTYTAAGTYTVSATNTTTGCMRNMSGAAVVNINALPTMYAVTSSGSNYCAGGTGITMGLAGSESGVSYQLYNGAGTVGSPVAGTGSTISFGVYTASGTYTVLATNTSTSCSRAMSGAANVTINGVPVAQTVTSSGTSYCAGTGGIAIGLGNSAVGVNYQLYNGVTPVGTAVAGTGSPLSLGSQTMAGTYMVVGTSATTGCTNNMTGTASVSINPAASTFNVTGGGNYCQGSTGVTIGLSGSNAGVNYQLYNGTLAVGGPVAGTGASFTFPGTYTTTGTYNVIATTGLGCNSTMTGSATVIMNTLPATFNVTGGGAYCNGGSGVHVGLSGSTAGIAYQLYLGTTPVGSFVTGTGLALDFGLKTTGGTYTVLAYNPATSCISNMNGNAIISVNSLPVVQSVAGGGSYCNGTTTGVSIGLENSQAGVSYQLYNGSAIAGSPVLGTGSAIDFGNFTASGTYTAIATAIGSGCQNAMSGSASVSISPLPNIQVVTGGGTICAGSTGANVYLNNSQSGVNYQLYNGPAPVGAPMSGTGSSMNLGAQTASGTYTVQAINATTGCVRNMSGAATINVNAQPALHTVTGGGNYCAGSGGATVGLGSSSTGTNYQLYNGTTPVGGMVTGTGGPLVFGTYTASGTYTVMGINATTGCSRTMTGTAVIGINSLPVAYTLVGGGSICQGATSSVTLSGSNSNVTYQLMNGSTTIGSPVPGTGGPLTFSGLTDAGTYMVVGTNNTTSCPNYMSGTPSVVVNALPTVYTVSGGGVYCQGGTGVEVGLSATNTGVSYQLYKGAAVAGTPVVGTGGDITFGMQTAAGTYTVMATNSSTGCMSAMGGSALVQVNALPQSYTLTGGGTICAGNEIVLTLGNTTAGIEYSLKNGSAPVSGSMMLGTGASLDFAPVSAAGTYVAVATDPVTGCSRTMDGSSVVVVNAVPVAQSVTGGGNYCAGGAGVAVGLGSSQAGVTYQLMNGTAATGAAVAGTGSSVSFGQQTAGTYSVLATNAQGCTAAMTGTAVVNANTLPSTHNVLSLGSSYCAGGEGIHVLLGTSTPGISYQLFRSGTIAAGSPMTGTGMSLDFGAQTAAGVYTVKATETATGCEAQMSGNPSIAINPLPVAYTLTGGGGYCAGTAGAEITLANSATGVTYQLYTSGGSAVGTGVAGSGSAISFGQQTAGSYYVIATSNATACTNNMSGTVTNSINALPTAYAVNGGGAYCTGGSGVAVGMENTATGISYQLLRNGNPVGTAIAGTSSAISFGMQTVAGDYTVKATNSTTGCENMMSGTASVSINAAPGQFTVTGGGTFCAGGTGVSVGLNNSATGVNYQLYNGSTPVSGALMAGTGSSLDFGMQTTGGSYMVQATSTANGCSVMMTGAAAVTANAQPTAYLMTGGGSYCASASSTGVAVGLSGSQAGMSYQLMKDGSNVGTPVTGTGSAISFGMQSGAGNYTAVAMNSTTGCTREMTGTSTVTMSPAITPAVTLNSANGTTVCLGVLNMFTATPVNGGISPVYQWKVNGANVGLGTNSYGYVPSNGDVVTVEMTSSEACALPAMASTSMTMSVSSHQTPKAIVSVMPNDTVCAGTMVTYSATAEYGGTAPVYVWKKNGVQVGTGATYQYVPNDGDNITLELTSNFPCRLADMATANVKMNVQQATAPVVGITANPGTTIAAGQSVILTATATGAVNAGYQWSVNGAAVQGATNATYISNKFMNQDMVTVDVTSNSVCGVQTGSKTIIMSVGTTGVTTLGNIEGEIRLLPNPNKGEFTVRGTLNSTDDQELHVDVTDMLGQVVYRGELKSKNGEINSRIELNSGLANGMYMLTLRNGSEAKVFHFVLQQ